MCGRFEVGVLNARATGLEKSRQVTRPWVATQLTPTVAWLVHPRIALWLEAGASISLSRPALATADRGEFYRVPTASFVAEAGLEVRWPSPK